MVRRGVGVYLCLIVKETTRGYEHGSIFTSLQLIVIMWIENKLSLSHRNSKTIQDHESPKVNLCRTLNLDVHELSFEVITVFEQLICTRRQSLFKIFRNSNTKIGFNTTANKLFYLNNKIGLEHLNLSLYCFKRLAKIMFLKYGKTWPLHGIIRMSSVWIAT